MKKIDLRSDTVTQPTPAMRAAMAAAAVGDDVFGNDPTVNALQERIAALLGKEAALFVASGTQSNLIAIMSHCGRGDEYLVGQGAHCYRYEAGGAAVLGSVQPQPIEHQPDGSLALENTLGGKVMPMAYLADATALARRRGLATHLDGARLFNAAVKLGVAPRSVAAPFDSVSVCFSKGLGAPVGSALVGSRALIAAAQRWRKMLGGGMRQAGVVAAAALHALDHHVERLADDHALAARLAEGLAGLPGVVVEPAQTNMVFAELEPRHVAGLAGHLAARGIDALVYPRLRLVTHLDVDGAEIDIAVAALREHLGR